MHQQITRQMSSRRYGVQEALNEIQQHEQRSAISQNLLAEIGCTLAGWRDSWSQNVYGVCGVVKTSTSCNARIRDFVRLSLGSNSDVHSFPCWNFASCGQWLFFLANEFEANESMKPYLAAYGWRRTLKKSRHGNRYCVCNGCRVHE